MKVKITVETETYAENITPTDSGCVDSENSNLTEIVIDALQRLNNAQLQPGDKICIRVLTLYEELQ